MAFLPGNPNTGTDHSVLVTGIIANSITVAVGEAVKLDSSGFVTNATASTAVLGVCVGFCDASFVPLAPSAYAAGTATSSDVQSVAAASDNQTVALKRALIVGLNVGGKRAHRGSGARWLCGLGRAAFPHGSIPFPLRCKSFETPRLRARAPNRPFQRAPCRCICCHHASGPAHPASGASRF